MHGWLTSNVQVSIGPGVVMVNRAWLRRWSTASGVGLALVCLLFAGSSARARASDAPPHRTARLSYLQGNVTVERTDNTGSDPALVNMPLPAGVRVVTGEDGQAEIEFEDGSLVRLTPNSALGLNTLSVDEDGNFRTQLAVVHGLAYAELRSAVKFTYSVDADGDVISPITNATVRINLDEPPAVISVLDGTVHIERAGSQGTTGYQTDVRSGETLTRDSSDGSRYLLSREVAQNSWDEWNESRDQAAANEAANQTSARDSYAGEQGYGWSDLDANGTWYNVPGQGMVWQPAVAQDDGFDPYGYGSWVYYPGAGYVWASGYGWGWTPFRCGNWSYWNGFGWGWLPGSGCGFGGWGFGGGGYVINVIRPPQNYRIRQRPILGPGPPHPIHIGQPVHAGGVPEHTFRGPRTIEGARAEPLRPVGGGYTSRGGSAIGSSLRRDYPVDRNSHQPVLGVVAAPAAPPATLTPRPGWRSGTSPPADLRIEDGRATSQHRESMRPPPPNGSAPRIDSTPGLHSSPERAGHPDRPTPQMQPPPAAVSRPAPPPPAYRQMAPPPPAYRQMAPEQRHESPASRPMQAPSAPRSPPSPPPASRSEPSSSSGSGSSNSRK